MVIVNRADTYEGERTPMSGLLDLVAQVLEARTGAPASDPMLAPLEVESDPRITHVPAEELQEFEGAWTDPPTPLGVDPVGEIRLTVADGHLVGYFPTSGTFNLYLQPDGTFHQEDSHRIFVPVRNDDGSLAGIVDQRFLDRESGS
jgi:hypothetical protein